MRACPQMARRASPGRLRGRPPGTSSARVPRSARVSAMNDAIGPICLASLFSTLLAGCFAHSSCEDFVPGTYEQMVELTPEQYAHYQMGELPANTGDPTTTGGSTTGTGTTSTST